VEAVVRALSDADIERDDVDGLGVASFTLGPDHAIDFAWRLGMRLRWLMEDTNGGASGINLLQHALRAIEAGDAKNVVLVAGDHFGPHDFGDLVDNYNRFTREHLASLPLGGPNPLFAFLTARHMEVHGLHRKHYGAIAVTQRRWAAGNPNAAYRMPLTMEEYLDAPVVAPPLCRYDCVPVVSGAEAVVLSAESPGVKVRALKCSYNADQQEGDGLRTGLADVAPLLWEEAGLGPEDVSMACVYDDYPAMVFIQLADLGVVAEGELVDFAERRLLDEGWPLNTSGGMLSAGQAGAAGGMHGLAEAATQLLRRAGGRQTEAHTALVSGYGMVVARYGAAANAAILERVE
jgi:acetyl-CoA acetyltransferase